jgi:hypothetical protein
MLKGIARALYSRAAVSQTRMSDAKSSAAQILQNSTVKYGSGILSGNKPA